MVRAEAEYTAAWRLGIWDLPALPSDQRPYVNVYRCLRVFARESRLTSFDTRIESTARPLIASDSIACAVLTEIYEALQLTNRTSLDNLHARWRSRSTSLALSLR